MDFAERRLAPSPDPQQRLLLPASAGRVIVNFTRQWGKTAVSNPSDAVFICFYPVVIRGQKAFFFRQASDNYERTASPAMHTVMPGHAVCEAGNQGPTFGVLQYEVNLKPENYGYPARYRAGLCRRRFHPMKPVTSQSAPASLAVSASARRHPQAGYTKLLPSVQQPSTPEELRDTLRSAAASRRGIELFGGNSKNLMAGPVAEAPVRISTTGLNRVLQYEPRDLTVSVESGMPFAELNALLARNGQMIPLDGPYSDTATVGGMIAANISGARRRLYGTARDLVIGMKFATLEGKLVQSGGMVVKNVAGLDMGKLMIGSFGTLAAIASINFKLTPRPAVGQTMLFTFDDLPAAMEARNALIRGVLNPVALDVLNPVLSAQLGLKNFTLAVSFAGNQAVIERSVAEASKLGAGRPLPVDEEQRFWNSVDAVTPRFLEKFREGVVVRVSVTHIDCGDALAGVEGPGHAHAANGIVRGWFTRPDAARRWMAEAAKRGWKTVVEFSSEAARPGLTLWPAAAESGGDFAIMKEIKRMFDPENLLNRGRLYGQL